MFVLTFCAVLYDSVTNNATRLRMIKNFTNFEEDLNNNVLPQWAFFTPNMTDDGHDTNVRRLFPISFHLPPPLFLFCGFLLTNDCRSRMRAPGNATGSPR